MLYMYFDYELYFFENDVSLPLCVFGTSLLCLVASLHFCLSASLPQCLCASLLPCFLLLDSKRWSSNWSSNLPLAPYQIYRSFLALCHLAVPFACAIWLCASLPLFAFLHFCLFASVPLCFLALRYWTPSAGLPLASAGCAKR